VCVCIYVYVCICAVAAAELWDQYNTIQTRCCEKVRHVAAVQSIHELAVADL